LAERLCLLQLNPSVAQQLVEALVDMGGALCAALPTKHACNNPACAGCDKTSEQQLVSGKGSVCSACRVARYCSVEHQPGLSTATGRHTGLHAGFWLLLLQPPVVVVVVVRPAAAAGPARRRRARLVVVAAAAGGADEVLQRRACIEVAVLSLSARLCAAIVECKVAGGQRVSVQGLWQAARWLSAGVVEA
jgi:hypothetical protein